MASIATGLDYETRGAKRSTGAKMRSHTSDQSGGTDSGDAREAWDGGYSEALSVRDGYPWPDALADLRGGRAVHLDVWHAAVGSQVCLSGSGSYGHTMFVLPDQHSDGLRWKVADPWCSPAAWKWVDEAKLRAGAEEWSRRVYGTAVQEADYPTGGKLGDPRDPRALLVVARIVRRLMTEHRPGLPDDDGEGVPTPVGWDTGGAPPILYTRTRALELGGDSTMVKFTPGADVAGQLTVTRDTAGIPIEGGDRPSIAAGITRPALGLFTLDDLDDRPCYLMGVGDQLCFVAVEDVTFVPDDGPSGDGGDTDERDAEWRAWLLEGSPGS